MEKRKGTRSPKLIGNMGGGERELEEREGEKRRGEEDMREQEYLVRGRIEESKRRDTIIEGAIIGLKRNLAPGKCPETYKVDPN